MSKEIRYYQNEAIKAVDKALLRKISKQLLVMATGSGKTFTAVQIVKDKGRLLWGTHTEELVEQSAIALLAELNLMPYETLLFVIKSHDGLLNLLKNAKSGGIFCDPSTTAIADKIGIIKADQFDIDKPIVIASMQTLWRRLNKIPKDHFNVFVIDEAHLSGANTWFSTVQHFDVNLLLGLTATPYRMDGMLMGDIFDEIVYEYDIAKGVKDKYLCEIDAIRINTNVDIDSVKTTAGELNQGDLSQTINTTVRNGLVVRKYKEYCEGRQFIASCASVEHAQDLMEAFKEEGYNVDIVVGNEEITEDRKGTISKFKENSILGLCHVMVLTAGFDHSEVSCCLQTSPTKSMTKYLQQVGRGTRLKKGEFKDLIILDFIDNTKRHKLINAWELDKAKPPEDRVFLSDEKKELLLKSRLAKIAKESNQTEITVDERVNLLALPKIKLSNSIRMEEPATEAQLKWIRDLGYDPENTHYTKKMCNEIISAQPAAFWQVKVLRENGYDVSTGASRGEFEMAKKEMEKKSIVNQIKSATNLNIII